MKLILIIILILFFLSGILCKKSFKTKSGNIYIANSLQTAEIIDILREIAYDVPNHIDKKLGDKLSDKLRNTTFKEITTTNHNILGWNYNKGREIAIRIFNKNNIPYSSFEIVDTLLHELGHSITTNYGHGEEWQNINKQLQILKSKYVNILINKTFLHN